ncbi:MAG: hypothetical protein K6G51_04635, partial [Sphaerochaetaceae bacterium]|nr:hypothetical protein [Sphaerochaetaceae bacterium]
MVLAKAIRAFCEKNVGSILDVQQVARDYFPMASYKTFLRTLNRLRDEGLIVPVSKGMYLICGNEQVELDIDDVV